MTWRGPRGGEAGCWFSFRRSHLPAGLSETQINTASTAIYKLCSRHNFTHYLTDSKVQHASAPCIQSATTSAAFVFFSPSLLPFSERFSVKTSGGTKTNSVFFKHFYVPIWEFMNMITFCFAFVCWGFIWNHRNLKTTLNVIPGFGCLMIQSVSNNLKVAQFGYNEKKRQEQIQNQLNLLKNKNKTENLYF